MDVDSPLCKENPATGQCWVCERWTDACETMPECIGPWWHREGKG
jgi:hypothetical protein